MSDPKLSDAKSPPDLSMDEILASIRRIIAEDDHVAAPTAATASGEPLCLIAGGDDDILELTEAVDDSGNVRRLVAPVAPSAHSEPESSVVETATPAADPPEEPATEPAGVNDDAVVSEATVLAASASFAQLASLPPTPSPRPEPAMLGERQLDDIVRELLRPLLRAWLDENLPPLVERLVRAEIARIVEQSRTSS